MVGAAVVQPGPHSDWVTSERATITAVHPRDGSIDALTDDGRGLHFDRDAASADRLAHAYAVTAHRAQGATVDTAHVLDDGGGRELAYVAMSRARATSHIYTTAADPAEAAERVAYSWEAERRPTWATDQGQPTPTESPQPEPDALQQVGTALEERGRCEYDLQQLRQGTGRWTGTSAGRAALNLTEAKADNRRAARHASDPALRRRERRESDHDLAAARQALEAATADWETHGQPHASRLETLIAQADLAVRQTLDTHRAQQAQRPWASLHHSGNHRSPPALRKNDDTGLG